jgi:hypothetical protein
MGKAYLLVHEPQDAIPLVDSFPAKDTGDHEHEQNEIVDKCGEDTDSDVRDMIKHTLAGGIIDPVPANCGCN